MAIIFLKNNLVVDADYKPKNGSTRMLSADLCQTRRIDEDRPIPFHFIAGKENLPVELKAREGNVHQRRLASFLADSGSDGWGRAFSTTKSGNIELNIWRDVFRWYMPGILKGGAKRHGCRDFSDCQIAQNLRLSERDPWSLVSLLYLHDVQLPLHDGQLILEETDSLSSSRSIYDSCVRKLFVGLNQSISLSARTFHLDQLIGHNIQLGLEDKILQSPYDNDRDRKQRDENGSIGGSTRSTVLGIFILLCGAAVMKVAFGLLDAPNNPTGLRLIGWGIGGVAGLLVGQGTILLLTGNWIP
jgi:hypothetical protein